MQNISKISKRVLYYQNAGHFNVEIDMAWLHKHAEKVIQRDGIETFLLKGKAIHVLAEEGLSTSLHRKEWDTRLKLWT